MSFVFPLNLFGFLGQIIVVLLGIFVFRHRRKKKKSIILFSLPLLVHIILLLAITGFSLNSFRQHEKGDFERIALGARKYLATKAGMTFLQPSKKDLAYWDKKQQEQKEISKRRSSNRDKDASNLKESKSAIFSVDDDTPKKKVETNVKDPF